MHSILGLAVWAPLAFVTADQAGTAPPPLRQYQAFGTHQQIGAEGRGTLAVGLEVAFGTKATLNVRQYRDRLLQTSNDFRPVGVRRFELEHLATGDRERRSSYRLIEHRRTVKIELDGTRVDHEIVGVASASTARRMPSEVEDPLVIDSDFVVGYQLLIDHVLAGVEGVSDLDGQVVTAIVPSKLATYEFAFEVLGTDSLRVAGGDSEFVKMRITRVEPLGGTQPRNASLDESRLFWVASDGEIVRMDIRRQARFQGESTTYNLRYRPDFHGHRTDRLEVDGEPFLVSTREARSTVDPAAKIQRAPAVFLAHDGSDASRAILASTSWNLARRGMTVGSLRVDPSEESDLARAGRAIELLERRPTVLDRRVFLITVGAALPRETPWDLSMFAAWAIVNGVSSEREALVATLSASNFPVLILWGDDGAGMHDRREFAHAARAVAGSRAQIVPLAQIDASMAYVVGVPSSAPKDDFGLAFGYVRGLGRWFDAMRD